MFSRNEQCISNPRLIAFYGYPGCGKDTAAAILCSQFGWKRVAFADPIRVILWTMDPIVMADPVEGAVRLKDLVAKLGFDTAKRTCPEIRRLLQRLGKEAGRDVIDENVWVDVAMRSIDCVLSQGSSVVISDLRFPNEVEMVLDMGGAIVKIERPGCEGLDHASEQHYGTFTPDYVIQNDGSLELLKESVETLHACLLTRCQ